MATKENLPALLHLHKGMRSLLQWLKQRYAQKQEFLAPARLLGRVSTCLASERITGTVTTKYSNKRMHARQDATFLSVLVMLEALGLAAILLFTAYVLTK